MGNDRNNSVCDQQEDLDAIREGLEQSLADGGRPASEFFAEFEQEHGLLQQIGGSPLTQPYTFTLEDGDNWRSRNIVYVEPGKKLSIYVEVSGVPQFDFVGSYGSIETWDEPPGEPIPPEKQEEIITRLSAWSKIQKLRIDLGPRMTLEELEAAAVRLRAANAASSGTSRPKDSPWQRVAKLFSKGNDG